ncbi:uncharacterized protein MONOS_13948 [Monocercomonoides exilis]|uniref:uncharacterized protein n=1 Tax=Monocercomonoides exilis TaxID=2049356 RepID=UPI003559FA18|nr:hypothetical protein MONOS_13948 [Monocercomonoides exilis]|eukprot:MONOS_13948.1-p1 / transcript=MONOS_13948.1 / gene=MONOS_13948 / organism=Monocercomonoides_exilis_PA203 / gene_product=unspecified product / transcript_product=unspecified product / location=Mono_scaffold00909:716-7312(-) / protein_length=2199 / sequence_SO=supercontig / SO=protein_coding / is_pseudo=false
MNLKVNGSSKSTPEFKMKNTKVDSCCILSKDEGSLFFVEGFAAEIYDSLFNFGVSSYRSSIFVFGKCPQLAIFQSVFQQLSGSVRGGCVLIRSSLKEASVAKIAMCSFKGCTEHYVESSGGCIAVVDEEEKGEEDKGAVKMSLGIEDCIFSSSCASMGAAVAIMTANTRTNASISRCYISDCTADRMGSSAFLSYSPDLTSKSLVTKSDFAAATISNDFSHCGGAIFVRNCYLTIEQCVIANCTACRGGGGIYVSDNSGTLIMKGSEIKECTSAEGNGGGLYFESREGMFSIEQCLFSSCKAGIGQERSNKMDEWKTAKNEIYPSAELKHEIIPSSISSPSSFSDSAFLSFDEHSNNNQARGGAIFNGERAAGKSRLANVSFKANVAAKENNGASDFHDMCVTHCDYWTKETVSDCFSSSSAPRFVVRAKDGSEKEVKGLLGADRKKQTTFLIGATGGGESVKGEDYDGCGVNEEHPCLTMQFAWDSRVTKKEKGILNENTMINENGRDEKEELFSGKNKFDNEMNQISTITLKVMHGMLCDERCQLNASFESDPEQPEELVSVFIQSNSEQVKYRSELISTKHLPAKSVRNSDATAASSNDDEPCVMFYVGRNVQMKFENISLVRKFGGKSFTFILVEQQAFLELNHCFISSVSFMMQSFQNSRKLFENNTFSSSTGNVFALPLQASSSAFSYSTLSSSNDDPLQNVFLLATNGRITIESCNFTRMNTFNGEGGVIVISNNTQFSMAHTHFSDINKTHPLLKKQKDTSLIKPFSSHSNSNGNSNDASVNASSSVVLTSSVLSKSSIQSFAPLLHIIAKNDEHANYSINSCNFTKIASFFNDFSISSCRKLQEASNKLISCNQDEKETQNEEVTQFDALNVGGAIVLEFNSTLSSVNLSECNFTDCTTPSQTVAFDPPSHSASKSEVISLPSSSSSSSSSLSLPSPSSSHRPNSPSNSLPVISSGSGSCVCAIGRFELHIHKCRFTNNTASLTGGALNATNTLIFIKDSSFIRCSVTSNDIDGARRNECSHNVKVHASEGYKFNLPNPDPSLAVFGGALHFSGCRCVLDTISVHECTSSCTGGGIMMDGCEFVIENSSFHSCFAGSSSHSSSNDNRRYLLSSFEANKILARESHMQQSSISSFATTNSGSGSSESNVQNQHSNYVCNMEEISSAELSVGGGLSLIASMPLASREDNESAIISCYIFNCTAGCGGGGVFISGSEKAISFENCSFDCCMATHASRGRGGAIHLFHSMPLVASNTAFTGCGAARCFIESELLINSEGMNETSEQEDDKIFNQKESKFSEVNQKYFAGNDVFDSDPSHLSSYLAIYSERLINNCSSNSTSPSFCLGEISSFTSEEDEKGIDVSCFVYKISEKMDHAQIVATAPAEAAVESADDATCISGESQVAKHPCKTIQFALDETRFSIQLTLLPGLFSYSKMINVKTKILSLEGSGGKGENVVLAVERESGSPSIQALLRSEVGMVVLKDLGLLHPASGFVFKAMLLVERSSSLTLTNCAILNKVPQQLLESCSFLTAKESFANDALFDSPFLYVDDGATIKFENTTCSNIHYLSDRFMVSAIVVQKALSITLSNTSWANITNSISSSTTNSNYDSMSNTSVSSIMTVKLFPPSSAQLSLHPPSVIIASSLFVSCGFSGNVQSTIFGSGVIAIDGELPTTVGTMIKYVSSVSVENCTFTRSLTCCGTVAASLWVNECNVQIKDTSFGESQRQSSSFSMYSSSTAASFLYPSTLSFDRSLLNEDSPACFWSGGDVKLLHSIANLESVSFFGSGVGGLFIDGSDVSLSDCAFSNNTAAFGNEDAKAYFPHSRRNVMCVEGGKVTVKSLKSGSDGAATKDDIEKGTAEKNFWLFADESCWTIWNLRSNKPEESANKIAGETSDWSVYEASKASKISKALPKASSFFVPLLSTCNISKSTKDKTYVVHFNGEHFYPCKLQAELVPIVQLFSNGTKPIYDESQRLTLTSLEVKNENLAISRIDENVLLKSNQGWGARLLYLGDGANLQEKIRDSSMVIAKIYNHKMFGGVFSKPLLIAIVASAISVGVILAAVMCWFILTKVLGIKIFERIQNINATTHSRQMRTSSRRNRKRGDVAKDDSEDDKTSLMGDNSQLIDSYPVASEILPDEETMNFIEEKSMQVLTSSSSNTASSEQPSIESAPNMSMPSSSSSLTDESLQGKDI